MTNSWFTMAAKNGRARIDIYDEIGAWGVNARAFLAQLKALGEPSGIDLHINSPGGSVFDALAIYNNLRNHKAEVTVHVDGLAASAASVIAMAGDRVLMPENAMMMIHDPRGLVGGTAEDMRELAEALDKIAKGIVSVYAGKSGQDREKIAQLMKDETWLSAAEAVDLGFADEVVGAMKIAAFHDLSRFEHPPEALHRRPLAGPSNPAPEENPMAKDTTEGGGDPKTPAAAATPPAAPAAAAEDYTGTAADISALCAEKGCAAMAAQLIRNKVSLEEARTRVSAAVEIRSLVATANKACPAIELSLADQFLAAGTSTEGVKAALYDKLLAAQSAEIANRVQPGAAPAAGSGGTNATNHGWDNAVAKVTGKKEA